MILNAVSGGWGESSELETVLGEVSSSAGDATVYFVARNGQQQISQCKSSMTAVIRPAKGTLIIVDAKNFLSTVEAAGEVTPVSSLGGSMLMGCAVFLANGAFSASVY